MSEAKRISESYSIIDGFPVNFCRIRDTFKLDSLPTNCSEALIRWVILEPAPSEIWEFIPTMLFWLPILEPFSGALGFSKPVNVSSGSHSDFDLLAAKYPPVGGRAGGKTNVHIDDLKFSKVLTRMGLTMLATLNQFSNNDWEETAAVALVLCDTFSEPMAVCFVPFLLSHPGFCSLPLLDYVKFLKAIHTGVRVTRSFVPNDDHDIHLTREGSRLLYGIDCITGRSQHLKMDIPKEMFMRMRDPSIRAIPIIDRGKNECTWSDHNAYRSLLKRCIHEAIDGVLVNVVEPLTFTDWYAVRMHWAASGGAPGAKVSWDGSSTERMNKRGALLIIPESHIRNILEKSCGAVLWSKASIKYENGKNRAIWNTSVEHYVIQAYILDMFEKHLKPDTWDSASNNLQTKFAGDIRRLVSLANNVGVMWDYSDFNINHIQESMADLFSGAVHGLLRRLESNAGGASYCTIARHDLLSCLEYVESCRFLTILEDPESDLVIQVVRSMQSGERATSFQNTFLSRAYTLMVLKWSRINFGRYILLDESAHLGDDVFSLARTVTDGVIACILFNLLGYAGQLFKITVDYGQRGEYLRLNFDTGILKIAGYPVRSAMGLIGGEFFRDSVVDPGDRASAFIDQYSKVIRRGGQIKPALLDMLIRNNCSLVYHDKNGAKHVILPNLSILMTPSALGGYGVSRPYSDAKVSSTNYNILSQLPTAARVDSFSDIRLTSYTGSLAATIPSGEGKTTLATHYPNIFVDHDDLLDQNIHVQLLNKARTSGDWSPVTDYHRSVVIDNPVARGKVILTWGREQVPDECHHLGNFILSEPTEIRANVENRLSLNVSKKIRLFHSFNQRDTALFQAIGRRLLGVMNYSDQPSLTVQQFTNGGKQKPPVYEPPNVPHSVFFSKEAMTRNKHASNLKDFQTLHRIGADLTQRNARQAVLDSALPGAYPALSISSSIAKFAERLEVWLSGIQVMKDPFVIEPLPQDLFDKARSNFYTQFREAFLNIVHYNRNQYPGNPFSDTEFEGLCINNNYGAFESLVIPAGFSSSAIMMLAIHEMEPLQHPGIAGKWFRFARKVTNVANARVWLAFENFVSARHYHDNVESLQLITHYFEGKLSFFPPPYSGYGSTPTSIFRAMTLSFVETQPQLFLLDRRSLYSVVSRLEMLCSDTLTIASFDVLGQPLSYHD
jgi:hypothetical protein